MAPKPLLPPSTNPCFRDAAPQRTFRLNVDDYVSYHCNVFLRNLICFLPCSPFLACVAPCERQNLIDYAEAVEVGVTQDAVVFCKQQTKTCWRCQPCDAGRVAKEIPLSQITDVVVREPAGGLCPREILYRVQIQTAGKSGVEGPEMEIVGLSEEDAYALRTLVKAGRRNQVMAR